MTLYRNFIRNNFHIFSKEKLFIVLVQPLVVILIRFVLPDSIFFISFVLAIVLLTSVQFTKNEKRSQFLYYWTVMSLSYTFIFFELIIVPLSEITPEENYLLMFFSGTSLIFLYFTTNVNAPNTVDLAGEHLLNKNGSASICPACKLKMEPRNFHCKICMECIPKYDHHSYWLNCCIGGKNFHCYLAGIFFGVFALAFASLLILTTICTPEYVFGILVPEDCTDVCSNIETCTCLVCGIYCMELSAVLLFKVLHHAYLISRGFSMFEWSEQLNHKIGKSSPYGRGFVRNWLHFFQAFRCRINR